jgi:hypothetical protein
MFTVLSKTRNSNLYLIAALATLIVVLLTFAVAPTIAAPKPVLVPVTGISEAASDYFQRHPELKVPAVVTANMAGDFSLRHPEWTIGVQKAAIPVAGMFEASDYFQRHTELSLPVASIVDLSDYSARHPELRRTVTLTDLSDFFLRH